VQVVDATTLAVLPGLSYADGLGVDPSDGEKLRFRWKGGDGPLHSASVHPVRFVFRFLSPQARLYSFWVSGDACGASRGWLAAGGAGYNSTRDMGGC